MDSKIAQLRKERNRGELKKLEANKKELESKKKIQEIIERKKSKKKRVQVMGISSHMI